MCRLFSTTRFIVVFRHDDVSAQLSGLHAGDLNELSKSVTYAGLVYLGFALLAGFFWVRALVARPAAYSQVQ